MSMLGVAEYTVRRPGPGTRVDGRMVPGADTVYTRRISIQPLAGTDRLNLPEGIRYIVTHKGFTNEDVDINDLVEFQGADHKVVHWEWWAAGLAHRAVFLTRIGEG